MTLSLSSLNPTTTTIQSLKEQVQSHLGGPSVVGIDKIKILLNKKPVPPSKKTVSDALDDKPATRDIEFGIMIMGGAPDPPPQQHSAAPTLATGPGSEKAAAEAAQRTSSQPTPMEGVEATKAAPEPVQPGTASGASVLESPAFWEDLQGFLEQRIRDQSEAQILRGLFENAWRSAKSTP
jgi:hypothetical protein